MCKNQVSNTSNNEIDSDNNELDNYDETLERDRFLFELITDTYNSEKTRNNNIDEKASKIIVFVGILISLQSAFGSILLKDVNTPFYYIYVFFFLLGLIFLIISIICGIHAYRIQKWKDVPKTSAIINYGIEDRDISSVLKIIAKERSKAVEENAEKMKNKTNSIKLGFTFFLLGIITTFIFILVLLFTIKL
jgi:hypothetical protein